MPETAVSAVAAEALSLRMRSQFISRGSQDVTAPSDVGALVRWFGAMQGQDLASLLWSLGLRLPGSTISDIDGALERCEALRTWPMRGTIHLVPPDDAAWMVRVLGEKPLAQAARRREFIGLSEQDAERSVELLRAALTGDKRLTRSQCVQALEDGGISGAGQRGYHLLWYASQRGVTCIAPTIEKEQTFALLEEWAPKQRELDREEALALIALRYFQSHGPASRQDFAGWAGITATDAKAGIAGCGDALASVTVEGQQMLASTEALEKPPAEFETPEFVALPGFDEYILGYKDRTLMVDREHMTAIIPGGNGVFRSTIVRSGRVIATWKRTLTKKSVRVDVLPIAKLRKADRRPVEEALRPFANFYERQLDVEWP